MHDELIERSEKSGGRGLGLRFMREYKRRTYVVKGPLDLVCEHTVHVRHDLDRHVDEALGEDEAKVVRGRQARWS